MRNCVSFESRKFVYFKIIILVVRKCRNCASMVSRHIAWKSSVVTGNKGQSSLSAALKGEVKNQTKATVIGADGVAASGGGGAGTYNVNIPRLRLFVELQLLVTFHRIFIQMVPYQN
jgi:hypothetical protein